MSQFTRVNGDFYPVMNYDQPGYDNPGANAVESGYTVQPQGPKLQYVTVNYTSAPGGVISGTQMLASINAIQQLATVYIYEYTAAATPTLAIGMYPVGAWQDISGSFAPLDLAITDALTAAGAAQAVTISTTATFTN
jgi:hypothetical protein